MQGLLISALLQLCCVVSAAVLNYEVAVQGVAGDVVKWATLEVDPASPRDYVYRPNEAAAELSQGCLGLLEASGFTCQTLFQQDGSRQSVDAYLNKDGSLLQLQFVEGPRSKAFLRYPDQVPRPLLKPPARAAGAPRGEASKQPQSEDVDTEEPEKSFVEKYWIYALPIGFLLITNMVSPRDAASQ